MNAIIYYATLPVIYLASLLPFKVLYVISDGLKFLIFNLIGYRKKIVLNNLRKSFPEKSEEEIQLIGKRFYGFFCDFIVETIKAITISAASLKKHVLFKDTSLFIPYLEKKQNLILVMGHYGNWELAGPRFGLEPIHPLYIIYHPLSNKYFDRLMQKARSRFGNRLYAMNEVLRGMVRDRNELSATVFVADQTPPPQGAYWTYFLNQETPVFTGTAKIAKKLKYPIIYINIRRLKRGLYSINSELLIENPDNYAEDEISEIHTRRLEKDIIAQPETWLWTHRRWKHKRVVG